MTSSSVWETVDNIDFSKVPVPEFAKDGIMWGASNPTTMFHSAEVDRYPWLQVDLRTTKLVKAVHLYRYVAI